MFTIFRRKGVDAKHRGDVLPDAKSHPPQSPFASEGGGQTRGQSCSISNEALPPAAVVLMHSERSTAKRSR